MVTTVQAHCSSDYILVVRHYKRVWQFPSLHLPQLRVAKISQHSNRPTLPSRNQVAIFFLVSPYKRLVFLLTFGFVIDCKDLAFGVGGMCAIGTLEIHFFRSLGCLRSSTVNLRWPELLPWLGLFFDLRGRHDLDDFDGFDNFERSIDVILRMN